MTARAYLGSVTFALAMGAVGCSSGSSSDGGGGQAGTAGSATGGSGGTSGSAGSAGTAGAGGAFAFEYEPPDSLGPWPVGMTTRLLVDTSRGERFTDDPDDNRRLPVEIWYPAAEAAAPDTFGSFFADIDAVLADLPSNLGIDPDQLRMVGSLDTGAARDVAIAPEGPFPLIVFSHGNGGARFQSFFLTEYLASHGYVVISPDHVGNAIVSELPEGIVPFTAASLVAAQDRIDDVSFLVDAMIDLNSNDPDGMFTGKVDVENVGITGHSFGGFTTLGGMAADERFDVGAPLTAGGPLAAEIDRPVQHFLATEDGTVDNAPIEANYTALGGPRMLIRVIDAGHFSFSNICLIDPTNDDGCADGQRANGETFSFLEDTTVHAITNFYETALFGFYLKGIDRYRDDLLAEPFSMHTEIVRDGLP